MPESLTADLDDEAAPAARDPSKSIKRLLAASMAAAVGLVAWNVLALAS